MKNHGFIKAQRNMIKKISFISFCLLLTVYSLCSGSTAAEFLMIGVGARPAGMGGAYTALTDDVNSIYWNPAGLGNMGGTEMTFMHNSWVIDTSYEFFGFATPLDIEEYRCVLGFGMHYMDLGSMVGRRDQVSVPYVFSASDMAMSIGCGVKLNLDNSIGIALKYIEENIENTRAYAFAADLGWNYALRYNTRLAVAVQNLGTGMKYISQEVNLPLNISAGLGYRISGALSLGIDLKQEIYNNRTSLSAGTEYMVSNVLALRGGSLLSDKHDMGLTGGFGLKIRDSQLDYAITAVGDLGPGHKISLSLKFK